MEKKLIKKYEEMEEDERNKLRELLKETSKKGKEESADGGTKLDWMYKGNKKDTESICWVVVLTMRSPPNSLKKLYKMTHLEQSFQRL